MKRAQTTVSWGLVVTLIGIGLLIGVVWEAGLQQFRHSADSLFDLVLEYKAETIVALVLLAAIAGMLRVREARSR